MNRNVEETVAFLHETRKHTEFPEKLEEEKVFNEIESRIGPLMTSDQNCIAFLQKVNNLSTGVTTQFHFKNNVQIFWRMVKEINGQEWYKLCLFLAAIGVMTNASSALSKNEHKVKNWKSDIAKWLGTQLTIGGKGVTGDGEGSVLQRIGRFFQTPYLHDFD